MDDAPFAALLEGLRRAPAAIEAQARRVPEERWDTCSSTPTSLPRHS